MFSTVRRVLGNTNPVWFEAQVPRDCENVPDQVNAGKPPKDICATVRIGFIMNEKVNVEKFNKRNLFLILLSHNYFRPPLINKSAFVLNVPVTMFTNQFVGSAGIHAH